MARFAARVSVILAAAFAPAASAEAFLKAQPRVTKEEIKQALLELSNSEQIVSFEDELRPMFNTLPKNERGNLEPSAGRYALHRYFVHKHGWYVKGLDPQGAGLGNSSSTEVLSDVAPTYILQLLEQQVHGRGLELRELAAVAATLSNLIFQEGFGGLWEVYRKLEFPLGGSVSEAQFDVAIRAYFSELVCGQFAEFERKTDFPTLQKRARYFYPEYDDIMMWAKDLRQARNFAEQSSRNPFAGSQMVTWDRAAEHLRELMHNFGSLTKDECRGLKEELLEMEVLGTGRVLLSDFYSNHKLQMHESVSYLRNLGSLEEEHGRSPRIIMPNYVASASRCTPFSSYFSICCRDECEGILGKLEGIIGTPTSTATRIAEVVSGLSSDSKEAPLEVSPQLLGRLEEIARHHNGQVPLHGRLFMQWMHHAFPVECPYPHVAGTTNPMSQDEWLAVHEDIDNVDAVTSEKEQFIQAERLDLNATSVDLPWTTVEELVAVDKPAQKSRFGQIVVRWAMVVVALVSFALPLVRATRALVGGEADKSEHLV